MLCLTKADLAPPDEVDRALRRARHPAVVTSRGADLTSCASCCTATSVFVGHSGVGKSTLMNALVPARCRATGDGQRDRQGPAHLVLGGRAAAARRRRLGIDTPGVRSFGLAHVTAEDLLWAFPDLEDGAERVPAAAAST